MNHQWLCRAESASLTLVFGGWAIGAGPFSFLKGGADVLFLDNFATLDSPLPDLARYDHVELIAFSFGVAAAAHWMSATGFRPTRLTAVAGTLSPADAELGIAPELIRATADRLCDKSFLRFCRRAGWLGAVTRLDIAAARAELFAVLSRGPAPHTMFHRIWIPTQDRIFSPVAQHAAWAQQQDRIARCPGPHLAFQPGQSWADWLQ